MSDLNNIFCWNQREPSSQIIATDLFLYYFNDTVKSLYREHVDNWFLKNISIEII
jgi:hypothetical protein